MNANFLLYTISSVKTQGKCNWSEQHRELQNTPTSNHNQLPWAAQQGKSHIYCRVYVFLTRLSPVKLGCLFTRCLSLFWMCHWWMLECLPRVWCCGRALWFRGRRMSPYSKTDMYSHVCSIVQPKRNYAICLFGSLLLTGLRTHYPKTWHLGIVTTLNIF